MQNNELRIRINKPIQEVYTFTITPPNSTFWIPNVVKEETNELPVRVGTIYTLTMTNGESFEVTVAAIEENKLVEWISKNKKYHCRYTFNALEEQSTELVYYEWVDSGELDNLFASESLTKLKYILEEK